MSLGNRSLAASWAVEGYYRLRRKESIPGISRGSVRPPAGHVTPVDLLNLGQRERRLNLLEIMLKQLWKLHRQELRGYVGMSARPPYHCLCYTGRALAWISGLS